MDSRIELEGALAIEDETERKLAVVAFVNDIVRDTGFQAVAIGGLAVEFWTQGAYSTSDIDLYLPHTPAVDEAFASAGFAKHGRHWVIPEHDLFVEAPASAPRQGEEIREVALPSGGIALVLSVEDVIVDRLHQFVAGGHSDVLEQAVALLAVEELDRARLSERVLHEQLATALREVDNIAARSRRGDAIETWELQEIARRLRKRDVD